MVSCRDGRLPLVQEWVCHQSSERIESAGSGLPRFGILVYTLIYKGTGVACLGSVDSGALFELLVLPLIFP